MIETNQIQSKKHSAVHFGIGNLRGNLLRTTKIIDNRLCIYDKQLELHVSSLKIVCMTFNKTLVSKFAQNT